MLLNVGLYAQTEIKKTFTPKKEISASQSDSALYSGNNTNINDTTKLYILKDYSSRKFSNKRLRNKYEHLIEIVKKVYPIAKLAGIRMEEYAAAADTLKRGQVKDLVAQIEEEVKDRFSQDIRKLTPKQGIILIKLLDRQTDKTGYVIIKELKNGFSAMIFQSLASLFNYDLKDEFDPQGVQEDEWIDEICVGIDEGRIK